MATTTKRATRNPTQADIIAVLLAQAVADAQRTVSETLRGDREDYIKAIAARQALTDIQSKVSRYLDGDISVLIR